MIGTVAQLFRYPVKSMGGEEVASARFDEPGVEGDRRWAVVDAASGKVASAKRPKLWRSLLECTATTDGSGRGWISLPDGTRLAADTSDAADRLSAYLGRPVTLETSLGQPMMELFQTDNGLSDDEGELLGVDESEDDRVAVTDFALGMLAPGTFLDLSPVHLLAASSLATLSRLHPDGEVTPRRFRPNLVVANDGDEGGFVENSWAGQALQIGEVRLRVIVPTTRCTMTTLAQGPLPRDRRVLQTLAEHNRVELPGFGVFPCLGASATVEKPGTINVGDSVELVS
jgi:uncharacterized protein YcbX